VAISVGISYKEEWCPGTDGRIAVVETAAITVGTRWDKVEGDGKTTIISSIFLVNALATTKSMLFVPLTRTNAESPQSSRIHQHFLQEVAHNGPNLCLPVRLLVLAATEGRITATEGTSTCMIVVHLLQLVGTEADEGVEKLLEGVEKGLWLVTGADKGAAEKGLKMSVRLLQLVVRGADEMTLFHHFPRSEVTKVDDILLDQLA
jgi:hypothetical protein